MRLTSRSPRLGPRPLIIGHRGFPHRHRDNSLAGVRAALAVGADGVELDVRPSADGAWVCAHDRTHRGRAIDEWPLSALGRDGLASLAEVAAAVPADRWLFVEVKPLARELFARHLEALLALLRPRADRTRLISSSEAVLGVVEMALPELPRSFVFGALPAWLPNNVALSPKHSLVEDVLWAGRELHPWTVNRTARAAALARLGVASITSNRPDLVLQALDG
jgi:glycerophosphoryl diester phosphodiesterase